MYYPGWQAFIDGEKTQIFQANYLFQAIQVPAGSHEVVFKFRPLSFFIGAIVSLLTLLGIFAILLINLINPKKVTRKP